MSAEDRYTGTDDPARWLREADACERDGYDITAAMLRSAAEQVKSLTRPGFPGTAEEQA